ncbi:unnamed protein product [marine sediment metagenome]|uniref:Uncharacterized protein n=1 Tax=marine sediment metagenome TaxID=412755 RepID=X1V132_9ZZZZ
MAKLKAPLLSLGASGAIGKSIVFFPWKGVDAVREYVIPTNPRSDPQKLQRNYLREAVAAIHAAQALDAYPLSEADMMALSLWGSCYPTPRTWFNQAVKNWIDCYVAGNEGTIFRNGQGVEGDTTLDVTIFSDEIDGAKITSGKFFWGSSKTALVHSGAAGIDAEAHSANLLIDGLTNKIKYFVQFRVDDGETCEGARSGIYHATPAAA